MHCSLAGQYISITTSSSKPPVPSYSQHAEEPTQGWGAAVWFLTFNQVELIKPEALSVLPLAKRYESLLKVSKIPVCVAASFLLLRSEDARYGTRTHQWINHVFIATLLWVRPSPPDQMSPGVYGVTANGFKMCSGTLVFGPRHGHFSDRCIFPKQSSLAFLFYFSFLPLSDKKMGNNERPNAWQANRRFKSVQMIFLSFQFCIYMTMVF